MKFKFGNIMLTSTTYKVVAIKKSTQAEWLCDVKVGDRICFHCPIKRAGRGPHGTYATHITVWNLSQQTNTSYTFNMISKVFDVLELEEC